MRTPKVGALLAVITLLTTILWAQPGFADIGNPSDIVFSGPGVGTFRTDLSTPLRGTYKFSIITCKFNQPRQLSDVVYSNPHRGVDQNTGGGLNLTIYPVTKGKVAAMDNTQPSGSKWLRLQLDIDRNGTYENVYFEYQHLHSISVSSDQVVDYDTVLGLTGSDHLDWRFQTVSGTLRSMPAFPYMINIVNQEWNGGLDLDFIVFGGFYQNVVYYYIYVRSDANMFEVPVNKVALFYRKNSVGGAWTAAPQMTKTGAYTFSSNIKSITGWPAGTKVDLLIRAERVDQNATNYRLGWYVPKYNQPPSDPNASGYTHSFITVTLE